MFLTTQDRRIFPVRGNEALIGCDPGCAVRLSGPGIESRHCRLESDSAGKWSIVNLTAQRVLVDENVVGKNCCRRISQPCSIRIGGYQLDMWESAASGPIAERLRRSLYELEMDLHTAVLDRLRPLPPAESEKEERERVEAEVERQFRNTRFDPGGGGHEFESYLALQAMSGMLISRIHGLGTEAIPASIRSSVETLLGKLETMLELGEESADQKTERVEALMHWVIGGKPSFFPENLRRELAFVLLRKQLMDLMFGFGPIGDLMKLSNVNDIMSLPSGHIFIERDARMQDSGRRMLSPRVATRIIERIITSQGRRIDQSSPMVDARVKEDGSRLNAVIEPVAVNGPALTIRRFSDRRITLEDLISKKTLPENVAKFLSACVLGKKNIVISGGTGSGKTTLLNALAAKIPSDERIVTVEDTAEMRLDQTHVITLQARPRNLEGKGEITIRDLVRNTLRMRPDRILVGECRGGETLDMLQAMNTGHSGSMTTIHANSAFDAVRRVETMAMEADSNLPSRVIREQIASAVDLIIQISRRKEVRNVMSVCEVVEFDEEDGTVIVEEIFGWGDRHLDKSRISIPTLQFTGYVPNFYGELPGVDDMGWLVT